MTVSKRFFVVASLALALFAAIQIGDTARPPHRPQTCSNTTISLASLASANITEIQINLIKQFWTRILNGPYPVKTKEYATIVIDTIDFIDSPSVRNALFAQTTIATGLLPDAEDSPGLCAFAAYINATSVNIQSHGKNCGTVVQTFTNIVGLTSDVCTLMTIGSLCNKCNNLPPVPRIDAKCYRRGRSYDIHAILNAFGGNIPWKLYKTIVELYESSEYADNIAASTLIYILPDELSSIFALHPLNIHLETLNIVSEDINPHCCHERLKRLEVLCSLHSNATATNGQTIVADTCHEHDYK